jgi:hypothetical protein
MVPPPISALKPKLGTDKHQDVLTRQAAERPQDVGPPTKVARNPVHDAGRRARDEDGFVTKVLQPDGSLMEEYFPAKAPR